jgi:hypothetical protein
MSPKPASPPQPKRPQGDQTAKTWTIIGFGTVIVLVAGFFALNVLMTEDRGGEKLVDKPFVAPETVRKPVVDDTPVPLLPKPVRLFEDVVKAIHRNDRKAILAVSEVEEPKIDLLLTPERVKIVTESLQTKKWDITEQSIESGKAELAAMFKNGRGYEIMGLKLFMRQRGGAEDWVITRIEDQWYATSGKMPENRFVELGADRSVAAAPIKEAKTFGSIPEAEPKELDWLPGTPEAQKVEIQGHIKALFDQQNPARFTEASQALTTIGKPAIPKLLSEFVNLDVRKEDDVIRGNTIDRTLAAMTDQEFGYDPATFQSTGALPPAMGRMRAIRRWFGWWEKNKEHPLPRRNQAEER